MRGSQVYVSPVSGDDGPVWEVKVAPFVNCERCPSGQVLDGERLIAFLKGFDAGFERVNARAVCFDACHECLFPPLLEALVAVGQIVRALECDEVKFLACYALYAPEALPKRRFTLAHAECHPFARANGEDRSADSVLQLLRTGDGQVVKAAQALECELAVVGVAE